jgi:hypothetical protein
MMQMTAKVNVIPDWTYETKAPGVLTFFEAIALAGLQETAIKLDAATQRALLGFAVFGRREITVHADGSVESVISTCFGCDYERAIYGADTIRQAIQAKKQLRPGTFGGHYVGCAETADVV